MPVLCILNVFSSKLSPFKIVLLPAFYQVLIFENSILFLDLPMFKERGKDNRRCDQSVCHIVEQDILRLIQSPSSEIPETV